MSNRRSRKTGQRRAKARARMGRRRQNRKLNIQTLEQRQLMAADITLSNEGVLKIDAGAEATDARVAHFGNRLLVVARAENGASSFRSYKTSEVKEIEFHGSDKDDTFRNQTNIRDEIFGNGGHDSLYAGSGRSYVDGGSGRDRIVGSGGHDTLLGGADKDWIYGNAGNDTIRGGAGDDELHGGEGRDRIFGEDGADFIFADAIMSRQSEDAVWGGKGRDTIYGGGKDDFLDGGDDQDKIYGGSGHDTIRGGKGNDFIDGGHGNDKLNGDAGRDTIVGGQGDDKLRGGADSDRLSAGAGNDHLEGNAGDDRLEGGHGNDTYVFDVDQQLGRDTIVERESIPHFHFFADTLDFSSSSQVGVTVDLAVANAQTVNDNLRLVLGNTTAVENVIGSNADDVIRGNRISNRLSGNKGNDRIDGRGGRDTYVFDTDAALGHDVITANGDVLDFSDTARHGITLDLARKTQSVNSNLTLTVNGYVKRVVGGRHHDRLMGDHRSNELIGGGGNDSLYGRGGNDKLEGQAGNDYLDGGEGDDRYVFHGSRLGHDRISDSKGEDTLDFSRFSQPIHVSLSNSSSQTVNRNDLALTLITAHQMENVVGTRFNDVIIGNGRNNEIWGGYGADILMGRVGNDVLWGGHGNDNLYGESGKDRLIGGVGRDNLFGGRDADGLFGGNDRDLDLMVGGGGEDRFLTREKDRIFAPERSDVEIQFRDGSSRWTDKEVAVVDEAFAQMQDAARTSQILKDRWTNDPLKFVKTRRDGNVLGRNKTWQFLFWNSRTIEIVDWNEHDDSQNRLFRGVVIHEVAHNFDESKEGNPFIKRYDQFHKITNDDNAFAWSYGKTNVKEDWATMWQVYFGYVPQKQSWVFQQKLQLVNQFFAHMANRYGPKIGRISFA